MSRMLVRAEDLPGVPPLPQSWPPPLGSFRWRHGDPTWPFTEPAAPLSSAGGGVNAARRVTRRPDGTEAGHHGGGDLVPSAVRLRPTSGPHHQQHHDEEARP